MSAAVILAAAAIAGSPPHTAPAPKLTLPQAKRAMVAVTDVHLMQPFTENGTHVLSLRCKHLTRTYVACREHAQGDRLDVTLRARLRLRGSQIIVKFYDLKLR